MASAAPVQGIQEETKCPICLEYLTDPVTMDCGHNFCQGCISNYCDKWEEYGPLECPVCRHWIQKGNLRHNWQLGNIVGKIRQLELNPSKENLCETHQENLDLFCEEDGEAVCVACWRSPQHRSHRVLLVEEAAQKYKVGNTLTSVNSILFFSD
nr:tripartite motif-containing protein 6-like [Chrysemys picta bellii]